MLHKTDVTQLDRVINDVSDPRETQCDLLREHLESARNYVLGNMEEEYQLSLRLALEAVDCVVDPEVRHRANETLSALMAEQTSENSR
jgi:hypothetical protein